MTDWLQVRLPTYIPTYVGPREENIIMTTKAEQNQGHGDTTLLPNAFWGFLHKPDKKTAATSSSLPP